LIPQFANFPLDLHQASWVT